MASLDWSDPTKDTGMGMMVVVVVVAGFMVLLELLLNKV